MKILLLSPKYPPYLGGTELHVKSLAEWLSKHDYKVIVCMLGLENMLVTEENKNLTIYRMNGLLQKIPILFKNIKTSHLPIPDQVLIKKISKVIKKEKPDIIHAHGWMLYSAIQLKKIFDIPLLATIHDSGFICPKKTLMRGDKICNTYFTNECIYCGKERFGLTESLLRYLGVRSQKKNLKYVDTFIAVSSFVKDMHSKYIDENRITVIPNFYDVGERYAMKSKESNVLPDDFILFVGALTRYKGAYVLIDAFNEIKDRDVKLVMFVKKYLKLRETKENIVIFEDAPRDLILKAYSRCRFFVIPSTIADSCPTVAFEAMSYKKAIIASDIGGLTNIVNNGSTGILVSPNNIKELVDAINILIENPDMALGMGMAGYNKFISNYTPEIVLPEIQAIYELIKK
jgi:glycosyltransferase involved in cell wall biosynthesis